MIKVRGYAVALMAAALAPAFAADPPADTTAKDVRVRAQVHFAFDQSSLSAAAEGGLMREVGQMKDVSWQEVVVVGYTDDVGPDDYNLPLSRKRADAVKQYLVGKGLDANMVRASGKGEADPVASNQTAEGRGRNRRAEVEFRGLRVVAGR